MSRKQYIVTLSPEQRQQLESMLRGGRASARGLTRARVLLKAAEGWTDEAIKAALDVSLATCERLRRRFALEGLDAALAHKAQANRRKPRLDGAGEAQLILLACSQPPEGREHWTLQLLADRLVELHCAESLSYETVRQRLKQNKLQPWRKKKLVPGGRAQRRVCL